MTKKYFAIFSFAFIVAMLLFAANYSYSQGDVTSVGPAPETSMKLPPSVSNDNVLNANNRGFVYLGANVNSFTLNKQFMGNTTVTQIGSTITTPYWIGAIARKNGVLYIMDQQTPFNIWTVDTTTGNITFLFAATGVPSASFSGMCYDHTTSTMYGVSTALNTSSQIFTINMTNGVCTPIGSPATTVQGAISLSVAPNGTLFSIDIVADVLVKWNKTTGVPTSVGSLGLAVNYGQDAAFDLSDGKLYWGCSITGPAYSLQTIDTTTGTPTSIGTYSSQPAGIIVIADMGPSISHTPLPNTQNLAGPYVVDAVVTPAGSPIASTKLYWSRNNPTVTDSVTMTNSSGNNWTGNIPGNSTSATYRYYIKAIDGLGRPGTHPGGAPASLNTFLATSSDTSKPVITHTPIGNTPKAIWPVSVAATATDPFGIDSVWVRWRINSGATKQFKLTNTSGSNYAALFNSLPTDVNVNDIIYYKIFAQDASGQHNRDSSVQNNFTIINLVTACIGNGTVAMGNDASPYNTYWYGARTNILFTAAEILANQGAAGQIKRIGFQVSVVGSPIMTGLTIRMQNTTETSLSAFVSSGWTTCYTGNYAPPGTGWQYIDLPSPYFSWNGTSNLLIEVCFGNTSYTTATTVLGTTATNMYRTEYHDLSTACAYTGFITGTNYTARANTCLVIEPPQGVNQIGNVIPKTYSLNQNYPNPFNPVTRINFAIPKQGLVSLKVYDILGREVKSLVNEVKAPGEYSVDFNAAELSSGVYFYRIESNGYADIKKMMLIK
jgi:hypothetical protein